MLWSCLFGTLVSPRPGAGLDNLDRLESGRTKAENALWIENPLTARFNTSKRVVVADIKGPAQITMIHFAVPASQVSDPIKKLDRELVIQMFWDGEATPSVSVPLVDFFGDPAGLREEVNTALVNKRRGFNCYFPMPFRSSARIELVYDGPVSPGEPLWRIMPCYSYVMYRTLDKVERRPRLLSRGLAARSAAPGTARLPGTGGERAGQVRRLERDRAPPRPARVSRRPEREVLHRR